MGDSHTNLLTTPFLDYHDSLFSQMDVKAQNAESAQDGEAWTLYRCCSIGNSHADKFLPILDTLEELSKKAKQSPSYQEQLGLLR